MACRQLSCVRVKPNGIWVPFRPALAFLLLTILAGPSTCNKPNNAPGMLNNNNDINSSEKGKRMLEAVEGLA